jgi:hypothetical protein
VDAPVARDAAPSGFTHPGINVDRAMLDFVKGKIAEGADPWKTALASTMKSTYASSSYTPAPVADVDCGSYSNPDIGCTAEMDDAIAAFTQALLFAYTGTASYAAKAIQIMNAWSAVLTEHTNTNAPLQSAWAGSVFPRAAEIIRYSNAGWAAADIAQFETMLRTAYLPTVINGSKSNGNWELSMAEATAAIGVFLDDQATFSAALSLWRGRVPAYVYLTTDGPTPVLPPDGYGASSLTAYWYNQTMLVDGVCQETCRDLGHVQYGLAAMINAAETARIQGVDLYSEQATRIVAGLEFHAQYLDGVAVPSWLCGGTLTDVTPDPTWEIAYNEYATRLGRSLPETEKLIATIRPTQTDHHMVWETLTHAAIGDAGIGDASP